MNADYCYLLPKLRFIATEEIAKILRETKALSKKEICANNRWRYHQGKRSVPIKYLLDNKIALDRVLEHNPYFVTHGGIYVKLPRKINKELSYICGLICGDGNLFTSEKRDYWVSVHNKEQALLARAIEILKNNFEYNAKIVNGHGCKKVEVKSEVIHSFFNIVMEIENGKKQNIRMPTCVKWNKEFVMEFIAGFFDAEGCVALKKNKITCQISFSQKQKEILEEIQKELAEEGIETRLARFKGSDAWILYGNRQSLAPFLQKIPIIHPKKKKKLETAVKNQAIYYNQKLSSDARKNPTTCLIPSTV